MKCGHGSCAGIESGTIFHVEVLGDMLSGVLTIQVLSSHTSRTAWCWSALVLDIATLEKAKWHYGCYKLG